MLKVVIFEVFNLYSYLIIALGNIGLFSFRFNLSVEVTGQANAVYLLCKGLM